MLALVAALAGCGGEATEDGIRLDDRERDGESCGVGDENNSCPGALGMVVIPNPRLREYVVMWLGWYTGPSVEELYARRFDAETAHPKGPSVSFGRVGQEVELVVTYEPSTRNYVVVTQASAPQPLPGPIRVQLVSETLHVEGRSRSLGRGDLQTIAPVEPGRVAVISTVNERTAPTGAEGKSLLLKVQTLDARNRAVPVVRRTLRRTGIEGLALDTTAVYDSWSQRLLVAWVPSTTEFGARVVRIDRIAESGGGGKAEIPFSGGPFVEGNINLACNRRRRDCLLLYAPVDFKLTDLHAHLLDAGGHPRGGDFVLARGTRGPIGVAATATSYAFAWNQGNLILTNPNGTRVVVAGLDGRLPRISKQLDRVVKGDAEFTANARAQTGLLAWRSSAGTEGPTLEAPLGTPGWYRLYGQITAAD